MLMRRLLTVVLLVGSSGFAAAPAGALGGGAPASIDQLLKPESGVGSERAPISARGTYVEGVKRRSATLTNVLSATVNPQQQLTSVDVAIDLDAQTFSAAARFAATPVDAEAVLGVVVGTWQGETCVPAFAAVASTTSAGTQAQFVDGAAVALTKSTLGAQIVLNSAAHPGMREIAFECAYARILDPETGTDLSVASPGSLLETYRPILELEVADSMVGARKGKWAKLEVSVHNTTQGNATDVRLRAQGKGIKVAKRRIAVGPVAGQTRGVATFKVKLITKKSKNGKQAPAPKPRQLTLTATDPQAETVSTTTKVVITPKPTVPKSLTGTYWWAFEPANTLASAGWVNHGLWFVDSSWVYTGWAEGEKPKCSAKVKECRRYVYNPRTGKVRIGKKGANVTSSGFTFAHPEHSKKIFFNPLTLPEKGSKIGVDLYRQDWTGNCLIMCTAWTDYLTMDKEGRFVEGATSVGGWPGLGTTWGGVAPDQRGTYEIVSQGIIELSYADGTVTRRVIGFEHDLLGRPDPASTGLLLGEDNYYD